MSSDLVRIQFPEKPAPSSLLPPLPSFDLDFKEPLAFPVAVEAAPAENEADIEKIALQRLQPLARQFADQMILPNTKQKITRLANQISGVICQLRQEFPHARTIAVLQKTWNDFISLGKKNPLQKQARNQFFQPLLLPAQDRFFHTRVLKNYLLSFLTDRDLCLWESTCQANGLEKQQSRQDMSLQGAWSHVIYDAISEVADAPPSIGRRATVDQIKVWLKANQPLLDQVKTLNFDGKLFGPLPPELKNFRNLEELRLGTCSLTYLPQWIGNFQHLKLLYLRNNRLTSIPDSIGNLTNLTFLSIGNNPISKIPSTIGNLTKLQNLEVTGNRLEILPPQIGCLINLEDLYIQDNQIVQVPNEIRHLTKLRTLNLSNNRIERLPRSLANLAPNLKFLSLNDNPLTQHNRDLLLYHGNAALYGQLKHIHETGS
jgi:hypothetical protein